MLLACAGLLEKDHSGNLWVRTQKDLEERLQNPDTIIRQKARAWKNRGPDTQTLIRFIRDAFGEDTPEGPARHKLQGIFEGYPFAGIVPEKTRKALYQKAYYPTQEGRP